MDKTNKNTQVTNEDTAKPFNLDDKAEEKLTPLSSDKQPSGFKLALQEYRERFLQVEPEYFMNHFKVGAAESLLAPALMYFSGNVIVPYLFGVDGVRRALKGCPKILFKIGSKQFDTQQLFYQDYLLFNKAKQNIKNFSFKFNKKSDDAVVVELENKNEPAEIVDDKKAEAFAENKQDAVKKELDLGVTFSSDEPEKTKPKMSKDIGGLSLYERINGVFRYGSFKNKQETVNFAQNNNSLERLARAGLIDEDALLEIKKPVETDEPVVIAPFKRDNLLFSSDKKEQTITGFDNFKGKYIAHAKMPLDETAKSRGILGQIWNNAKSLLIDTRPRLRNHWVEYPLTNNAVKLKQKHDAFNIAFDPATQVYESEHEAYAKHMVDTLKAQGFKSVHINLGKDEDLGSNQNSQQIIAAVMAYAQSQNMPIQSKNKDVKDFMKRLAQQPSATLVPTI